MQNPHHYTKYVSPNIVIVPTESFCASTPKKPKENRLSAEANNVINKTSKTQSGISKITNSGTSTTSTTIESQPNSHNTMYYNSASCCQKKENTEPMVIQQNQCFPMCYSTPTVFQESQLNPPLQNVTPMLVQENQCNSLLYNTTPMVFQGNICSPMFNTTPMIVQGNQCNCQIDNSSQILVQANQGSPMFYNSGQMVIQENPCNTSWDSCVPMTVQQNQFNPVYNSVPMSQESQCSTPLYDEPNIVTQEVQSYLPMNNTPERLEGRQFSEGVNVTLSSAEREEMVQKTLNWASNYLKSIGKHNPVTSMHHQPTMASKPLEHQKKDDERRQGSSHKNSSNLRNISIPSEIRAGSQHNTNNNVTVKQSEPSSNVNKLVMEDSTKQIIKINFLNNKKSSNAGHTKTSSNKSFQHAGNSESARRRVDDSIEIKPDRTKSSKYIENDKKIASSINKIHSRYTSNIRTLASSRDKSKCIKHSKEDIKKKPRIQDSKITKRCANSRKKTFNPSPDKHKPTENSKNLPKKQCEKHLKYVKAHNDRKIKLKSVKQNSCGSDAVKTHGIDLKLPQKSDEITHVEKKVLTPVKSKVEVTKNFDLNVSSSQRTDYNREDLRNKLKRKHPNSEDKKRDNLLITVQNNNEIQEKNCNENNIDKQKTIGNNDSKLKQESRKYKKIKLVINLQFGNSESSESEGDCISNDYPLQANVDLSFLDDFNVDDIVECLTPQAQDKPNPHESKNEIRPEIKLVSPDLLADDNNNKQKVKYENQGYLDKSLNQGSPLSENIKYEENCQQDKVADIEVNNTVGLLKIGDQVHINASNEIKQVAGTLDEHNKIFNYLEDAKHNSISEAIENHEPLAISNINMQENKPESNNTGPKSKLETNNTDDNTQFAHLVVTDNNTTITISDSEDEENTPSKSNKFITKMDSPKTKRNNIIDIIDVDKEDYMRSNLYATENMPIIGNTGNNLTSQEIGIECYDGKGSIHATSPNFDSLTSPSNSLTIIEKKDIVPKAALQVEIEHTTQSNELLSSNNIKSIPKTNKKVEAYPKEEMPSNVSSNSNKIKIDNGIQKKVDEVKADIKSKQHSSEENNTINISANVVGNSNKTQIDNSVQKKDSEIKTVMHVESDTKEKMPSNVTSNSNKGIQKKVDGIKAEEKNKHLNEKNNTINISINAIGNSNKTKIANGTALKDSELKTDKKNKKESEENIASNKKSTDKKITKSAALNVAISSKKDSPGPNLPISKALLSGLNYRMLQQFGLHYNITSLIRCGKYSKVFQCHDSKGNMYALKVTHPVENKFVTDPEIGMMMKLCQCDIPKKKFHCVFLIGDFGIKRHWCFLMEHYATNLQIALAEHGKCFHIDLVQKLSRQLVSAILVLRNNNIAHLAIKPEHILLNGSNDKLKLAGFDEAQYIDGIRMMPNMGTVSYRPPEVILGYPNLLKVDVWAAGLILYEMATNIKLFPGCYNNDILYKQQCTFGHIPHDMLQQSLLVRHHYNGLYFLRIINKQKKVMIHQFNRSNRLSTTIFKAYNQTWAKSCNKVTENKDKNKLQLFINLLVDMLALHPRDRLPVEFAYTNPFIYESAGTELLRLSKY